MRYPIDCLKLPLGTKLDTFERLPLRKCLFSPDMEMEACYRMAF